MARVGQVDHPVDSLGRGVAEQDQLKAPSRLHAQLKLDCHPAASLVADEHVWVMGPRAPAAVIAIDPHSERLASTKGCLALVVGAQLALRPELIRTPKPPIAGHQPNPRGADVVAVGAQINRRPRQEAVDHRQAPVRDAEDARLGVKDPLVGQEPRPRQPIEAAVGDRPVSPQQRLHLTCEHKPMRGGERQHPQVPGGEAKAGRPAAARTTARAILCAGAVSLPVAVAGRDSRWPHRDRNDADRPRTALRHPRTLCGRPKIVLKSSANVQRSPTGSLANDLLITAIREAGLDLDDLAAVADVDPRTAQRWLGGRVPHPRYRHKLCAALHASEADLWPDAVNIRRKTDLEEIAGAWAKASDQQAIDWRALLRAANEQVDLLGYSLHEVLQARGITKQLASKAADGCLVRIAIANPDSDPVIAADLAQRPPGRLTRRINASRHQLEQLQSGTGSPVP